MLTLMPISHFYIFLDLPSIISSSTPASRSGVPTRLLFFCRDTCDRGPGFPQNVHVTAGFAFDVANYYLKKNVSLIANGSLTIDTGSVFSMTGYEADVTINQNLINYGKHTVWTI